MDSVKLAQGKVLEDARSWFRNYLNFPPLNKALKFIIRRKIELWSMIVGMSFPAKYDWDWKLEMLLGKYEKETLTLVKNILHPGAVVIDIGAHIGYYTRIFSRLVGKVGTVYAFEPSRENYELLKKNTAGLKNVRLFNEALGERPGEVTFYESINTGCHSIVPGSGRAAAAPVKCDTLDNLAARIGRPIDFIKIDIEGGEPVAFAGAKNLLAEPQIKIVMEFTPANFQNADEAVAFLAGLEKNYGFIVHKILIDGKTLPIRTAGAVLHTITDGLDSVNLFLKK